MYNKVVTLSVCGVVLSAIASQFSTTEVPRKLMQKAIQTVSHISSNNYPTVSATHFQVMVAQNFSGSYPYLTFLGRLLHTVSPLCTDIIHSFGMKCSFPSTTFTIKSMFCVEVVFWSTSSVDWHTQRRMSSLQWCIYWLN